MRVALLVAALALAMPLLPATPPPIAAEARLADVTIAELMQATALDLIFDQFGEVIATSARMGDISTDAIFLSHWEAAAASVFNGPAMRTRLAKAMDGKLSTEERATLGEFFRSDFGLAISALERAVAQLSAADRTAALAEGAMLSAEAGVVRSAQLDQLMELMSAEISGVMAGQSLRALLLGMSMSQQRGDIQVPWQEIDAQVEAMMPSLIADHSRSQRAMMAYAYRELSDDELDRYIAFLNTAPAQKLYAIAAYAVGQITARSMTSFGEALAVRMASVSI